MGERASAMGAGLRPLRAGPLVRPNVPRGVGSTAVLALSGSPTAAVLVGVPVGVVGRTAKGFATPPTLDRDVSVT